MFYSQYGQDIFVSGFFERKPGVFIDIGAYDGIKLSNTYYLEKELGWKGICVEPSQKIFPLLYSNRDNICVNKAITESIGTVEFSEVIGDDFMSGIFESFNNHIKDDYKDKVIKYSIETTDINNLLDSYKMYDIDYMSIDTEGSENIILRTLDYKKFNVKLISYEMNNNMMECRYHLVLNGYEFLCRLGQDEFFTRNPKKYGEYLEPFYANMIVNEDGNETGWKGVMYRRNV